MQLFVIKDTKQLVKKICYNCVQQKICWKLWKALAKPELNWMAKHTKVVVKIVKLIK